ncbi:hypothetical protein Tco_0147544 [Tanacetum coccineum]
MPFMSHHICNGVGASGGGGAIPHGIHVWIERFTKLKLLAFRSAATPAEAEDWIMHMEKLFQVLGCPDNFKTRLVAFKLEGDALSWWKAHLRTHRYFPAAEQQRYEREYGSICQLDRGYDSKRQDFRGQDQRFAGRNGNDRQGQGNYNQRQHRNQSTRDFNQGHASSSAGEGLSLREAEAEYANGFC